ncbi:hypothetical protein HK098_004455 [Nowakowskiella sp. JEL0407]|nr:hypothetical protein HK098_004455 [Nowakowskiella sp. JEL0407]
MDEWRFMCGRSGRMIDDGTSNLRKVQKSDNAFEDDEFAVTNALEEYVGEVEDKKEDDEVINSKAITGVAFDDRYYWVWHGWKYSRVGSYHRLNERIIVNE